jgi:hypothetical protein
MLQGVFLPNLPVDVKFPDRLGNSEEPLPAAGRGGRGIFIFG